LVGLCEAKYGRQITKIVIELKPKWKNSWKAEELGGWTKWEETCKQKVRHGQKWQSGNCRNSRLSANAWPPQEDMRRHMNSFSSLKHMLCGLAVISLSRVDLKNMKSDFGLLPCPHARLSVGMLLTAMWDNIVLQVRFKCHMTQTNVCIHLWTFHWLVMIICHRVPIMSLSKEKL
jgi:hypothetical protein